jgi:hypothetical protein
MLGCTGSKSGVVMDELVEYVEKVIVPTLFVVN